MSLFHCSASGIVVLLVPFAKIIENYSFIVIISIIMTNERTSLILSQARLAYEVADIRASRLAHDQKKNGGRSSSNNNNNNGTNDDTNRGGATEEGHQKEGGLVKPIIFGGLDGILTSFAIVAGAAGGNLSPKVVLILGFSNIFADALSMGVGEFLSSKAENEWILSERRREEWELENYPEGEIQEMIEIYQAKGMSAADAQLVVTTMAQYKDFFVDIMMAQELELQVPDDDHVTASMREGCVMFAAFAFFGALPLLGYVVIPSLFPDLSADFLFAAACVITGVVLFFMGSIKSFVSCQHWFRAGLETLFLGGACATVAFTIGQVVSRWTGSDFD